VRLRPGTFLVRLSVSTLALVAACCGILAWQLSRAPVSLPYLAPRIESALAELVPGTTAHVDRAELAWVRRRPMIRVIDLRLLDTDGSTLAWLPGLAVRPSIGAALHGRLAVAWIGLSGARLQLALTPDGRVTIDTREEGPPTDQTRTSKLLIGLLANRARGGPAGYLWGVDVDHAAIDLANRASDVSWSAIDAQIGLRFRSSGTTAKIQGTLLAKSPTNPFIRDIEIPVNAVIDTSFRNGSIKGLQFDLHTEGAHVASYADPNATMRIDAIEATGEYTAEIRAVQIHRLHAVVGATSLEATARIPVGTDDPFQAEGTLRALAVDDLPKFWPATLEPRTRSWIAENVHAGTVSNCRFQLRLPPHANGPLPAEALSVAFDYDGLTVAFLKHFEPLRAIRGAATLTGERFIGDVESGVSAGLNLRDGRIDIDLHAHPARAAITARVNGAIPDMLAVIDQPPLEIPKKLGIASETAAGEADVQLGLQLPLAPETTSDDVRVTAAADLRSASHPDLRSGIGIRDAALHLDIDDGRIAVRGDTDVTNAPFIDGRIHADFVVSPPAPVRSVTGSVRGEDFLSEGTLTLDDIGLSALTLSALRFGRTDVTAELARDATGRYRTTVTGKVADLEPLWNRPQQENGEGSKISWPGWDLDFTIERVLTGRELEITDAEGHARGDAGSVQELHATGGIAGGGALQVDFASDGEQPRFELATDQGGRFLKELGVDEHLKDGKLTITGTIDERVSPHTVQGEIEMNDFRVVQAPWLAQILTLGSLEGIANTLRSVGIAFARARVPFTWSNGEFEFHEARAVGAIGLTADGFVDTDSGDLDITGQVIPAYTLNSALGKIPLIGNLLVGGEGQGIFGLNYRVGGTREKPAISANPLSAFAPGILRQMFIDPFTRKPGSPARNRLAAPPE